MGNYCHELLCNKVLQYIEVQNETLLSSFMVVQVAWAQLGISHVRSIMFAVRWQLEMDLSSGSLDKSSKMFFHSHIWHLIWHG